MEPQIIKENFWPPYLGNGDAHLYSNEIGWRDFHRIDARSNDTHGIFKFYVDYYAFNLVLYYVEEDTFLYVDAINGNVFILQPREDWDGQYIFERCEFTDFPDYEPDYIFQFKSPSELWDNFQYAGHDLKYLIEHSVVDTQH